ncbi:hypothetical protein TNCV_3246881 [Trichonephila clavipes]|nr:hypothetical protein TNCV_3246881 [Trichonephila clavipes]
MTGSHNGQKSAHRVRRDEACLTPWRTTRELIEETKVVEKRGNIRGEQRPAEIGFESYRQIFLGRGKRMNAGGVGRDMQPTS